MGDGYEISIKRLAKQKAEGKYPDRLAGMKPKDRSFDPSGQITADEPDVYEETPKMKAIKQVWDMANDLRKVPDSMPEDVHMSADDPPADDSFDGRKKKKAR